MSSSYLFTSSTQLNPHKDNMSSDNGVSDFHYLIIKDLTPICYHSVATIVDKTRHRIVSRLNMLTGSDLHWTCFILLGKPFTYLHCRVAKLRGLPSAALYNHLRLREFNNELYFLLPTLMLVCLF